MGDKKRGRRGKKRRYQGNQHNGNGENGEEIREVPNFDSGVSVEERPHNKPDEGNVFMNESCFFLMDIEVLNTFISSSMRCPECGEFSVSCGLDLTSKLGFCLELRFSCKDCPWREVVKTSKDVKSDLDLDNDEEMKSTKKRDKEINVRMVSFVRSLGRGHSALTKFSMHTNSPEPMTRKNYRKIFMKVHGATQIVAEESMMKAAREVKEKKQIDLDNHNEDVVDCAVSIDGTWQRRGHASHHGVVTTISVDTGKCLDVETLSNICNICHHWEERKDNEPEAYEKWRVDHRCKLNHKGSAGAMEGEGSVRIFGRSKARLGLQFTEYLGDGDSSSYKKVRDSLPYGKDTEIVKLECVGHVQKRCGNRLRRLKNEKKGVKLSDGKALGGLGRLTDKKIDTLQNFYGMAIRQHRGDLEGMVSAVKAVLPHVASTEARPMHNNCPRGPESWCGYQRDRTAYKHRNGLPDAVVEFVRPVFDDLADVELLRRCLHGKTQNSNENLNKLIWDRCSKEYYVDRYTVEEAVWSAVCYLNDGYCSVENIFSKLGVDSGTLSRKMCRAGDDQRQKNSSRKSMETTRKRRKTLRAIKKGFQDSTKDKEGDVYNPGGH